MHIFGHHLSLIASYLLSLIKMLTLDFSEISAVNNANSGLLYMQAIRNNHFVCEAYKY